MIVVRINGKCNAKDKIGGWSAIVNGKELVGGAANTTHNRMELTALIEAVKSVKPQREALHMQVVTKNNYIPNAFRSFKEYQKRNFVSRGGTKIANLDLWDKLIVEANRRNIILHSVQ